jgi:NodT family efflux transporter outer membrane factor (OMF) lipoprotein
MTRDTLSPRTAGARPLGLACAGLMLLAGCSVGPDYRRPAMDIPAAYKENAGWTVASPGDGLPKGPWWEVFKDPVLNDLEAQVEISNETVREAVATYDEAVQIVRSDRTGYLPTVSAVGSAQRSKSPQFTSGASNQQTGATGQPTTTYTAQLQASWEPDIWGKLRRTVEADAAAAAADAADLANARLSMQATLAQDYIGLRATDEKMRLLEDAVSAYERTLKITKNKYQVGVAARSDIITAQTQLDSTRAQLISEQVTRAQFEHAIAVLVGKAPSAFSLARTPQMGLTLPQVPPQLASTLLERRPDVAAAERQAQAANARIGIQTAAYFPTLSLTADAGYEGSPLGKLLTAPFKFWTLGAQASDALLDWGQRHDLVLSARAAYEFSAANYRQTVLTALQQVEDNLAGLRILESEAKVQDAAVTEAAEASKISVNEYNAGTVDFTTVVAAEVTELNNRETALGIVQSQLDSSVALIQALGGGWDPSDSPKSATPGTGK